jgi:nucleotide-binding universal stress UspA family protein
MTILCAIGLRRGPELLQRLATLVASGRDLLLVHVIDEAPRQGWEHAPRPLRPGSRPRPDRDRRMDEAEIRSGETILAEAQAEAQQLGFSATVRLERGNPERVLVQIAQAAAAELVVEFARELPEGFPAVGPPSIGHTARFVLDHAPCPVLLLR